MKTLSLYQHFQSYFEITLANTPTLLEDVYRIRYDVYCQEFQFEKLEDFPQKQEQDEYDKFSLHCLVRHRSTGLPAGCVRLVRIPQHNPALLLPCEKFCGYSLTHETWHPGKLPRDTICEISRLAVHTSFRQRFGEFISPIGHIVPEVDEIRTFPLISVALVAASTSLMVISQRSHLFIMCEPFLVRFLRQLGLNFIQVGETIDYHGRRAGYYIRLDQMLEGMRRELKEIYDFVHQSLVSSSHSMNFEPIS